MIFLVNIRLKPSSCYFRWSSDYFFLSALVPFAGYERVRHLWGTDIYAVTK